MSRATSNSSRKGSTKKILFKSPSIVGDQNYQQLEKLAQIIPTDAHKGHIVSE
jgi:hypothetical protein